MANISTRNRNDIENRLHFINWVIDDLIVELGQKLSSMEIDKDPEHAKTQLEDCIILYDEIITGIRKTDNFDKDFDEKEAIKIIEEKGLI